MGQRIEHEWFDGIEKKICSKCKKWKELNYFCKCKNMWDGLYPQCKVCKNQADSSEKHAWRNMIRRCTNPKNKGYKNYGARGITVCERWLNSFEDFLEDMGKKPSPELTLERIDNDKGYCKENCKWATRKIQANNTRPKSCGPAAQYFFYGHGPEGQMIIENCQAHVARVFDLDISSICNCLNNKQKQHKGWTFQKIIEDWI